MIVVTWPQTSYGAGTEGKTLSEGVPVSVQIRTFFLLQEGLFTKLPDEEYLSNISGVVQSLPEHGSQLPVRDTATDP